MITHTDKLHDLQCDPSECLAGQDTRGAVQSRGRQTPRVCSAAAPPSGDGAGGRVFPGERQAHAAGRFSAPGLPVLQPRATLSAALWLPWDQMLCYEPEGSMPLRSHFFGGTLTGSPSLTTGHRFGTGVMQWPGSSWGGRGGERVLTG